MSGSQPRCDVAHPYPRDVSDHRSQRLSAHCVVPCSWRGERCGSHLFPVGGQSVSDASEDDVDAVATDLSWTVSATTRPEFVDRVSRRDGHVAVRTGRARRSLAARRSLITGADSADKAFRVDARGFRGGISDATTGGIGLGGYPLT